MNQRKNKELTRNKTRVNLLDLLKYFSAFMVFVMMALMVADVFGREVLNRPLPGALELIEITVVLTIFGCLPVVSWAEDHVTADLFDGVLTNNMLFIMRAFGCCLGAGIFSLASWQITKLAARAVEFNDLTPQLGIKISWILYYMIAMCAVTSLSFLARSIWLIRRIGNSPSVGTH